MYNTKSLLIINDLEIQLSTLVGDQSGKLVSRACGGFPSLGLLKTKLAMETNRDEQVALVRGPDNMEILQKSMNKAKIDGYHISSGRTTGYEDDDGRSIVQFMPVCSFKPLGRDHAKNPGAASALAIMRGFRGPQGPPSVMPIERSPATIDITQVGAEIIERNKKKTFEMPEKKQSLSSIHANTTTTKAPSTRNIVRVRLYKRCRLMMLAVARPRYGRRLG